jgi:predicted nucleotide-binding protein
MRLTDDVEILMRSAYAWDRARAEDNGRQGQFNSASAAKILGWSPERLNRAVTTLEKQGFLDVDESGGSHPFCTHGFELNEAGIMDCERRGWDESSSVGEKPMEEAPDPRKVFVIHGRHDPAREELAVFLRAMDLQPVWFTDVRKQLGGSPNVIDIVARGMKIAQGVIALFVPEEFASLHPELKKTETGVGVERWQARPNVIFEAGMAYQRDPARVVLVVLGQAALYTDVAGIHVLRPTNAYDKDSHRAILRGTLAEGMQCAVNMHSNDWMTAGDFDSAIKGLPEVSTRDPFLK